MKLAVVGGLTLDLLDDRPVVGGPPWYAGTAAHAFGARVSLYSAVGEDFLPIHFRVLEEAELNHSNVVRHLGQRTYCFKPTFTKQGRRMKLVARGPDIKPENLENLNADAVIVSPVFKEVEERHLEKIRAQMLAVDLQGFLREVDAEGNISLRPKQLDKILKIADLIHCSEEEALALFSADSLMNAASAFSRKGVKLCLVGARDGLYLIEGSQVCFIKPSRFENVVDTTGAGDILTGAFTALILSGLSAEQSAAEALAAVMLSLKNPPPKRVPEKLDTTQLSCRVVWRKSVH
ncbi:MAG: PfkB family carbohydrate kinase [Candidatus Caldarchaeum sp.]|nr:PfkB family carbohydrate kinase [Candidatus Caldarchaeum sp.]